MYSEKIIDIMDLPVCSYSQRKKISLYEKYAKDSGSCPQDSALVRDEGQFYCAPLYAGYEEGDVRTYGICIVGTIGELEELYKNDKKRRKRKKENK